MSSYWLRTLSLWMLREVSLVPTKSSIPNMVRPIYLKVAKKQGSVLHSFKIDLTPINLTFINTSLCEEYLTPILQLNSFRITELNLNMILTLCLLQVSLVLDQLKLIDKFFKINKITKNQWEACLIRLYLDLTLLLMLYKSQIQPRQKQYHIPEATMPNVQHTLKQQYCINFGKKKKRRNSLICISCMLFPFVISMHLMLFYFHSLL